MAKRGPQPQRPERKFYASITIGHQGGCWLWTAGKNPGGYGNARRGGRGSVIGAHRLSWILHRGPIPPGRYVLHRCDVRACVYPGHLFLGTHADNMRDMSDKGRGRKPLTEGGAPCI